VIGGCPPGPAIGRERRPALILARRLPDVLAEMLRRGTTYAESTIRTHVVSKMTMNAPALHASRSSDFEALGAGLYRLLKRAG
jgi:hypothetical protein